MTKIYHNPRCSKSRETLQLLKDKGIDPEIILYLETPPGEKELGELLTLLGKEPREIMRTKEAEYKESGADDKALSREQLIAKIIQYPRLLERPIVVNNGKAALGRPPENVLKIL